MISRQIVISNKLGLHARAATKFANVCGRFTSKMQVCCNGKTIDGKSIMSLMLLAASKGTSIEITADGHDEEEAMAAIVELIEDKFGEGE
ncbi:HPr family phosphocarrier protein [Saccharophagus sp. K07]|jgi:phosphocarrier protein HPr|uniref:HPr family phosphocarrier protein n=1 Tax=Saccharophagus sp. K07 TaxID=2283636 RepID=UPI0016523EFE|nr:HPr family phosphocarrier protein [Saccharophagus sp. K07]MBC6907291.1 HPr family phosphocarrier protein [Saccharophagus sp. K07]